MSTARAAWQNVKAQMSKTLGAIWVTTTFKSDLGPTFDDIVGRCDKFNAIMAAVVKDRDKAHDEMAVRLKKHDAIEAAEQAEYKKAVAAAKAKGETADELKKIKVDTKKSRASDKEIGVASNKQEAIAGAEVQKLIAIAQAIKKEDDAIKTVLAKYGALVADQCAKKKLNAPPWDALCNALRNTYTVRHNGMLKDIAKKLMDYHRDMRDLANYTLDR